MKQKKIDFKKETIKRVEAGDDSGEKTVYSFELKDVFGRPGWIVSLDETEFCELSEVIYAEYTKIRRYDNMRPTEIEAGIKNRKFFISRKLGFRLLNYLMTKRDTESVEKKFEAIEYLIDKKGERKHVEIAKVIAKEMCEHGAVALFDLLLRDEKSDSIKESYCDCGHKITDHIKFYSTGEPHGGCMKQDCPCERFKHDHFEGEKP